MARRPRSASLKALPPDSVQGVEVQSISTAAVHWNVNSKEKPTFARQRPLKSVSLKLAKGDGSPTASRSNSTGAAWGSGELLIDARQCIPKAGSGPPSRGSATEAPEKCSRDGRSRQSQTLPSRCKATGETSATVGKPPVPKSLEVSVQEPNTSSYPSRSDVPVLDEETSSRPSSSSYQRAAAIYASLPKTPGGTRTLVQDADGFIFRPSVEAEVKAAPQPRLRPGSRGLNELVASLTKRKAAAPRKREDTYAVEDPVRQADPAEGQSTRPEIPPPRIAWSEGSLEDGAETSASADASELAAQIRRDWLAKQLSGSDELEGKNGPSEEESKEDSTKKTPLRTEDGRRSMGELEKSLAKAKERAEKNRKELKGYMESLRNKMFQAEEGNLSASNEELLVSLPADFDDVVDINASLTAAERRRSRHRNSISSGGGLNGKAGGTSSAAELTEGFRLPTFLEKYFYEEKAVELPIVQIQQEESDLDRVTRQVAKLDVLLTRREADGLARLQAAKEELEATKEHLRRESEQSEAEKIELLKKLKEKGLLRSQSSTSKAASAASSSANSPRHSVSVSCFSPSQSSEVDWSGWECSVEVEAGSAPSRSAPPFAKPEMETSKEEESDTSTFNLTATTADLNTFGPGTKVKPSKSKLAPVVEDTVHEGKIEEQETAEGDELAVPLVPLPLPEELLQDPYDLEALHAIDDKLAQIVPESEWEAKSIRSETNGSEVSAGVSKTSKHSVLSHLASSSLPGEPVLREQLEEREARKALIAIDDQLGRLQEQRQSELQPEQLQQLLLQAAASESAMDSSSKVLTLTADVDDLEASLQRMLQPFRITADPVETTGPLVEAKKILSRLSQSNEEWDSTNLEARYSMVELEDSVRAMEERASQPNMAQKEKEQTDELIVEMSTWATKLEELSQEALMVAEQGLPQVQDEGETGGARGSDDVHPVDDVAKGKQEAELDDDFASKIGPLMLPSLKTAEQGEAPMEDADLDLSLDSDGESESSGNSPVFLPVSEVEVTKAVELDLPEGDWSDEDLERLSKAMEEHFGPRAKPQTSD